MTSSLSNYYCHFLNSICFTGTLNNSHVAPPKTYKEGFSPPEGFPSFLRAQSKTERNNYKFQTASHASYHYQTSEDRLKNYTLAIAHSLLRHYLLQKTHVTMAIIILSDFQVRLKVLPHVPVHRAPNDLQFGWFAATTFSLQAQVLRWKSQLLHSITAALHWIPSGFSPGFISPTGPTRPALIRPRGACAEGHVLSALHRHLHLHFYIYF